NAVVHRFAASRPGTQTPDYASLVNHHPELLQSDNLHPTEEGAERRAELIAQGVLGCIAYEEAGSLPGGPATASAQAAPVKVKAVRFSPVGRQAARERRLAAAGIDAAALLATLRSVLPGG
ncbi:MAG: hypothetical protein ACM3NV_00795, partial [Syntrophothermus sp.]